MSFLLGANVVENALEIVRRDRRGRIAALPTERLGAKLFADGTTACRLDCSHEVGHGSGRPECHDHMHMIGNASPTENSAVGTDEQIGGTAPPPRWPETSPHL